MELSEVLNNLTREAENIDVSFIESQLKQLNYQDLSPLEMVVRGNKRITNNLISNTEFFACYGTCIPKGFDTGNFIQDYGNVVAILLRGNIKFETAKGTTTNSFGSTVIKEFELISVGGVIKVEELSKEVMMSNPYSQDAVLLCISMKYDPVRKEVLQLSKTFDAINGVLT